MPPSPLITLQTITKSHGTTPLFAGLSLVVAEGERLALVGNNGCGKSTLLQVMVGVEEIDDGAITSVKGLHTAYVPQQESFPAGVTVSEVVEEALVSAMCDPADIARRISVALGEMGFRDNDTKVDTLSGGWRKRLSIAAALAREPDLLLLDEPTNHLDIDSIVWLEEFISSLRCAVVFVSHDRYFIENLATRVLEINRAYPGGALIAEGSYSAFLEYREQVRDQMERHRATLQNKVRREVEWLRQGVKARTTKSQSRIDEAHRLMGELAKVSAPDRGRAGIEFSSSRRKTKDLIVAESVSQSRGGKELFRNLTLSISPGTRLAIVGPNGSGKTTLIKTLFGELPPTAGTVQHANNLSIALFDQARGAAQQDITLKEFLCPEGDSVLFQGESIHVAGWAARFLFSRDHLGVSVASLSGGEKARALLARIMVQRADILLFDEPTNDLDIATLEVLEESLESFAGGVIIVTHDRYLLDKIGCSVVGLGQGHAQLFGDYPQWEIARREQRKQDRQRDKSTKMGQGSIGQHPSASTTPKPKLSRIDAKALANIERDINTAEQRLAKIQEDLSDPVIASDAMKLSELCAALSDQQKKIDSLYQRWEELEASK